MRPFLWLSFLAAPEACKLDKTGDLSFFKQQDTVVIIIILEYTHSFTNNKQLDLYLMGN